MVAGEHCAAEQSRETVRQVHVALKQAEASLVQFRLGLGVNGDNRAPRYLAIGKVWQRDLERMYACLSEQFLELAGSPPEGIARRGETFFSLHADFLQEVRKARHDLVQESLCAQARIGDLVAGDARKREREDAHAPR